MDRHHHYSTGPVPFTAQEELEADEEEAKIEAERPMQEWKQAMIDSDYSVPRYLEDIYDVLTDEQKETMSNNEKGTKFKVNAKKELRASKPG